MSLYEPRCLVCGAPLGRHAPFEKDVRNSEVCSDKCYELYMYNEDEETNQTVERTATRCACEPGQDGPCSFCMEAKYNL